MLITSMLTNLVLLLVVSTSLVFSSPISLSSPLQLDFHLLDFSVKDGVNYIIVEEVEKDDETLDLANEEVLVTEEEGKNLKRLKEKTVEGGILKESTEGQQQLEEEEIRLRGNMKENEGLKEKVAGHPLEVELSSLGGAGEWVGSHLGR